MGPVEIIFGMAALGVSTAFYAMDTAEIRRERERKQAKPQASAKQPPQAASASRSPEPAYAPQRDWAARQRRWKAEVAASAPAVAPDATPAPQPVGSPQQHATAPGVEVNPVEVFDTWFASVITRTGNEADIVTIDELVLAYCAMCKQRGVAMMGDDDFLKCMAEQVKTRGFRLGTDWEVIGGRINGLSGG